MLTSPVKIKVLTISLKVYVFVHSNLEETYVRPIIGIVVSITPNPLILTK